MAVVSPWCRAVLYFTGHGQLPSLEDLREHPRHGSTEIPVRLYLLLAVERKKGPRQVLMALMEWATRV